MHSFNITETRKLKWDINVRCDTDTVCLDWTLLHMNGLEEVDLFSTLINQDRRQRTSHINNICHHFFSTYAVRRKFIFLYLLCIYYYIVLWIFPEATVPLHLAISYSQIRSLHIFIIVEFFFIAEPFVSITNSTK